MNALKTSQSIGLRLATALTLRSNKPVATNNQTPVYYIDECKVTGDRVQVDYTINHEWAVANLSITDLKNFVRSTGLNEWVFDSCVSGEHQQDSGCFNVDDFLAENLNLVVKNFLQTTKVWQNV